MPGGLAKEALSPQHVAQDVRASGSAGTRGASREDQLSLLRHPATVRYSYNPMKARNHQNPGFLSTLLPLSSLAPFHLPPLAGILPPSPLPPYSPPRHFLLPPPERLPPVPVAGQNHGPVQLPPPSCRGAGVADALESMGMGTFGAGDETGPADGQVGVHGAQVGGAQEGNGGRGAHLWVDGA